MAKKETCANCNFIWTPRTSNPKLCGNTKMRCRNWKSKQQTDNKKHHNHTKEAQEEHQRYLNLTQMGDGISWESWCLQNNKAYLIEALYA